MEKKFAIFDIDGTIATRGVIPENVLKGFTHLQEQGYLTTVSTGRSYVRMRHALGDAFDQIVADDSLIIVEHGTKIVKKNGEVVQADYFSSDELDHVVDFSRVNLEMIRLLWFSSPDPKAKIQIWCKSVEEMEKELPDRGWYADLFTCPLDELRLKLGEFPVNNVSAKLEPFVAVENLKLHFTRSEIDTIFQDSMMEYIRNISDKSKAVKYVEDYFKVKVEDMLLAGNAINDLDMLNLPAGKRILVGSGPASDLVMARLLKQEEIIRVDSPEMLGEYLQNI